MRLIILAAMFSISVLIACGSNEERERRERRTAVAHNEQVFRTFVAKPRPPTPTARPTVVPKPRTPTPTVLQQTCEAVAKTYAIMTDAGLSSGEAWDHLVNITQLTYGLSRREAEIETTRFVNECSSRLGWNLITIDYEHPNNHLAECRLLIDGIHRGNIEMGLTDSELLALLIGEAQARGISRTEPSQETRSLRSKLDGLKERQ